MNIAVAVTPDASYQPFEGQPEHAPSPTSAPTIATRCAQRGPWTVTEYRATRTIASAGNTIGAPASTCSSATA